MHRAVLLASILVIAACHNKPSTTRSEPPPDALSSAKLKTAQTYTQMYLHNVQLIETGGITLNVKWLRGRMYPAEKGVLASLDRPQSFTLDVQDGAIAVALTDVARLLNTRVLKGGPLSDVKLSEQGQQLKLNGMLHRILPIEALIDIGVSPGGQRIALSIAKLDVLKLPLGGVLKAFHVKPVDLIDGGQTQGMTVQGNDIVLDTAKLLPPPRNTGKLSKVSLSGDGQMIEVYGDPSTQIEKIEEWRNFVRLRDGVTRIGKLVMEPTDILLIDTSQDAWFTLDLAQIPEQLVNGYARLTPEAGLQMFIPDIDKIPQNSANAKINMEWVKNRNLAPPAGIP